MTKELFHQLILKEIEWLNYYSTRESRTKLNINSDIYKDLIPLGYVKKQHPLDKRCSPGLITSLTPITNKTTIDELLQTEFPRLREVNNRYTPLETILIIEPNNKQEWINKLIPQPIDLTIPEPIRDNNSKWRIRIR